jgi:LacI family gluconate utilization system Gnt-I transcriptional repressor
MEDVARRAEVSVMTVSRALRQPGKVAEATRSRIAEAMLELNYVPDAIASSLALRRSQMVALVVPSVSNPVFADPIQGMADGLRGRGYHLLLAGTSAAPKDAEALVRTLLGHRPAGFVMHGGNHTQGMRDLLHRVSVPVVEIGCLPRRPIDMVVGYSNAAAARAMTEWLLARGYQRIGFVSAPVRHNDRAAERRRGYRTALRAAGLSPRPEWEIEQAHGVAEGAAAVAALLERKQRLDAIFCAGDVWAIGALFECRRRGIRVPDDLAVVGFDGQAITAQTVPPLTTVQVHRYEMGLQAAELLLDRLAGQPVEGRRLDLGYELVVRESA